MKRSVSLLSNLLVSSTLFWGVPMAHGDELGPGVNLTVPAIDAGYCHMQFPPMREDSLSWARPVLDDSTTASINFYGSCDHDPLGIDEIKAQRRVTFRGIYEGGE